MLKEKIKFLKLFCFFIKDRKLWYMYPIFFALLLVFLIILFANIPWVWPFIYTIF